MPKLRLQRKLTHYCAGITASTRDDYIRPLFKAVAMPPIERPGCLSFTKPLKSWSVNLHNGDLGIRDTVKF